MTIFDTHQKKITIEDLMTLSKIYLSKCPEIKGLKKEISEIQLRAFVELFDENGKNKLFLFLRGWKFAV